MAEPHVIYEKGDGIATIALNRPESLNAYSPEMRAGIARAIDDIADDVGVKVMIITGRGRGFCSGQDMKLRLSQNPADVGLGERYRLSPAGWLAQRINDLSKPSIAAVNGVAAGGGFGLTLACDIRIASENARFTAGFVRRALTVDTGLSYFLPKLVGMSRALELALTGDVIDAAEALRIGLVNRVVPHEKLMDEARALAARLAKGPPLAIQITKRAMYRAQTMTLPEALEHETYGQQICIASEDFEEGRKAFVEKREPVFKGR